MIQLLIDVHTHPTLKAWEAAYDRAGSVRNSDGRPCVRSLALPEWDADRQIAVMDRYGIRAMLMSTPFGVPITGGAAAREAARAMNEEMSGLLRQWPDRLGAFAVLPLEDIEASVAEIAYPLDHLGLDGVYMPTNIDGDYFGDERFAPIFAELDRRRATLFVHPTTPTFFESINLPYWPMLLEGMFDSTRMITSLVFSGMRSRYPNFTLISTHAGGAMPYLASRLQTSGDFAHGARLPGAPKVWQPDEVWHGLTSFHFDLTSSNAPTTLGSILQLVPSTQLLFGTDFPIRGERFIAPQLKLLQESQMLDDAQRRDIFSGTALRLFPRLAEAIRKADIKAS